MKASLFAFRSKKVYAVLICVAVALSAVILFSSPAQPQSLNSASVNDSVNRALAYLRTRQNPDGGFSEPGGSSSESLTTWIMAAIASAGQNPLEWKNGGKSPVDFLAVNSANWSKLTDVERACFALASAGVDPRSFNGRNLVAEISANIAADGHIGSSVSEHVWGSIALKSSGAELHVNSLAWLKSAQNTDGGFSFVSGSASDPDDTGSSLQALVISGARPEDPAVDRALKYLAFCQAEDGGFKWKSDYSNTASTAWSVQGIAASGRNPDSATWQKNGRTPIQFLLEMQQDDGHIKYTESSDANPAWMTAEAIPALLKRPYPLNYTPSSVTDKPQDGDSDSSDEASTVTDTDSSSSGSPGTAVTGSTSLSEGSSSNRKSSISGPGNSSSNSMAKSDGATGYSSTGGPDTNGPAGSSHRNLHLSAFLVFCGTYIAVLLLSVLSAWYYRKEKTTGAGATYRFNNMGTYR